MTHSWQQVGDPSSWQQDVEITFMQTDVYESSIVLLVDPHGLGMSANTDESFRSFLGAVIVAVEAQGFSLAGAIKRESPAFQLIEDESEPEV